MGLMFEGNDEEKLQQLTVDIGHFRSYLPVGPRMHRGFVTLTKARGAVVGSFWSPSYLLAILVHCT